MNNYLLQTQITNPTSFLANDVFITHSDFRSPREYLDNQINNMQRISDNTFMKTV